MQSALVSAISKINPERIRSMASKYKNYLKWSAGIGGGIGFTFSCVHMLDMKDEGYKLSRKEIIAYPVLGTLGGAFLGVSSPVWIVFAPITYLFGSDFTGTLAKAGALAVLAMEDDSKDDK